jgi:hypothetical protein
MFFFRWFCVACCHIYSTWEFRHKFSGFQDDKTKRYMYVCKDRDFVQHRQTVEEGITLIFIVYDDVCIDTDSNCTVIKFHQNLPAQKIWKVNFLGVGLHKNRFCFLKNHTPFFINLFVGFFFWPNERENQLYFPWVSKIKIKIGENDYCGDDRARLGRGRADFGLVLQFFKRGGSSMVCWITNQNLTLSSFSFRSEHRV